MSNAQKEITLVVNFVGEQGVVPRLCRLYCPSNTGNEAMAAGFLDNYLATQSVSLLETDFIALVASDGLGWVHAEFTNGSCQLSGLN